MLQNLEKCSRAISWTVPIIYEVHRVRDGKSIATRRVEALQRGNVVFTLMASFQKVEQQFIHQVATMPSVSDTEDVSKYGFISSDTQCLFQGQFWDVQIRCANISHPLAPLICWTRCVVAYGFGLFFLQVSLNPHREKGLKSSSVSLDHSLIVQMLIVLAVLLLDECLPKMERRAYIIDKGQNTSSSFPVETIELQIEASELNYVDNIYVAAEIYNMQ